VLFGKGISKTGDIIDLGVEAGIVEKSGAWYSALGERIGQGRENARAYLLDHPELMATLEQKLREIHGLAEAPAEEGEGDEDGLGGEAALVN
jgi:recombination protein RecA